MSKSLSTPAIVIILLIAVLIVGFIGYKTLGPGKAKGGEGELMTPDQQRQMMPGAAQRGASSQPAPQGGN